MDFTPVNGGILKFTDPIYEINIFCGLLLVGRAYHYSSLILRNKKFSFK